MDERLHKHLQEQLAKERSDRVALLDEITALQKELAKHDTRDSALGVAEEKRKLAEQRQRSAVQRAEIAERKLRDVENAVLRLEEKNERLSLTWSALARRPTG